jgi:hypothetical protein
MKGDNPWQDPINKSKNSQETRRAGLQMSIFFPNAEMGKNRQMQATNKLNLPALRSINLNDWK